MSQDVMAAFSLKDKVALITGAGRGLGATIAETLGAAGAKVMVTDIDEATARAQAEKMQQAGMNAAFGQQDVTDESQWEATVAKTVSELGGLDVLVNNAGVETMAFFENCELADFQNIQNINVTGSFLGIKHCIRAMKPGGPAGQGGSIINLSSVAGKGGYPGLGAYCTSKGAARLMSRAAAKECAVLGYGIRVNSIHPAIIRTEMGNNVIKGWARLGLAESEAEAEALFEQVQPLGYGEPQDIGNMILFLASSASKWVTGSEFLIDGGARA
jgi:NAD(P)-dependent dehydrogenase (short-subunit alcohol dehydrogenase family)